MLHIANDILQLSANPMGAELTSIRLKSDNSEYLWQADPTVWGRHAPMLFPIVGRLRDDEYTLDSKTYNLEKHGFARNSTFELERQTDGLLRFTLGSSPETLTSFPFDFLLAVEYCLIGNTLRVAYSVQNLDAKTMYFSIGGHPAFRCPLVEGEDLEDCYIEFEKPEVAQTELVDDQALARGVFEPVLNNEQRIPMTKHMFDNDALIFHDLKSNKVSLKSSKSSKSVTMDFAGFPFLGIWARPGAPYVCLEPWYGICDSADANGRIEEKRGIQSLSAGDAFACRYDITIS